MKRTSLSRSSRTPLALRFTASECHDGKLELLASQNFFFFNSPVYVDGKSMSVIVPFGVDLAKSVTAVDGVDATGKVTPVLPSARRAELSRDQISVPALSATSSSP
jgi:hypothetical protein